MLGLSQIGSSRLLFRASSKKTVSFPRTKIFPTLAKMSDSEDEDLKRAIALSLESHVVERKPEVIDIPSSDEVEGDLDAPITYKGLATETKQSTAVTPIAGGQGDEPKNAETRSGGKDTKTNDEPFKNPTTLGGILGLDRKQMETERLERANRRMAAQVPTQQPSSVTNSDSKKRKELSSPNQIDRRVKAKLPLRDKLSSERHGNENSPPKVMSYLQQSALSTPGIQFRNGVVKKTYAHGYPRENDIKIEEVFQKEDLELAVLSAFQVEPEWVISKLKPSTKVVWILQAKTEEEKSNVRSHAPSNYKFCFPSMAGQINCMHSKLQLLAHKAYLRIVVPSANLVPYDWGEDGGIMENVCFLIDLPRLADGASQDPEQLTDFGKELFRFLGAMGLDDKLTRSILNFDFARTAPLAFVHSIGGSHAGDSGRRTGYCGLGNSVRNLGLSTRESINIDAISASLGNLTPSFISSLYLAAQGDDGIHAYQQRMKNKGKKDAGESVVEDLKRHFKIYFPSRQTVIESKGGKGAGGTICLQPQWYDAVNFPRDLIHDCKSRRSGLLMHSKILFVRPSQSSDRAWLYVGSANLSESAWGKLVKDTKSKDGGFKLNVRNWECGVIIPMPVSDTTISTSMEVFSTGSIPVPMEPGEPLSATGKRPWFYNEG